ncbi:MAG TPA: collagen-like protein [Ilumatobacteraceae bacterium]
MSIGAGGLITLASASGGGASSFTAITPCRLLDTRVNGPATGETPPRTTPLGKSETLTVTARGNFGKCVDLSPTATGAVLNVTTVNATASSYLTVWPADREQPLASNLNYVAGQGPTPNQVTTGLDSSGRLSVFNNAGSVDVIIDVVGLYEPASGGGGGSGSGGATGPAGPAGPKGEAGEPGPAGGPKGDKGDKGDQGDQGEQGMAGTQFMTSSKPDITMGNGQYSSMRLDANGNPVISDFDPTNGDLRFTRCYDPGCVVAHSNVVDDGGIGGAQVGLYTSLRLDETDLPVISYYDATNGDLKLAHCADLDCADATATSIAVVDSTDDRGQFSSLALDSAGDPVISYYDATSTSLMVAKCNDVNCDGGDDAPGAAVSTGEAGMDYGKYSSIAIGQADDLPTVGYYNATNGDLEMIHCSSVDCSDGPSGVVVDGSTSDVGADLSMALDDAGNPVFAYYDAATLALATARCDDADCSAPVVNEPLVSLPGSIDTGVAFDETALDSSTGRQLAVISLVDYSDPTKPALRVVRCKDEACSDFSTSVPDLVAGELPMNTSIVVDAYGNPTISRYDSIVNQLVVVHCADPMCIPHVKVLASP